MLRFVLRTEHLCFTLTASWCQNIPRRLVHSAFGFMMTTWMKWNFLKSMGRPLGFPGTSKKIGGASFCDRAELLMIMTEIDALQFVDNKNVFLENILKLASFQCLIQVELQRNSVTSPVSNKRTSDRTAVTLETKMCHWGACKYPPVLATRKSYCQIALLMYLALIILQNSEFTQAIDVLLHNLFSACVRTENRERALLPMFFTPATL